MHEKISVLIFKDDHKKIMEYVSKRARTGYTFSDFVREAIIEKLEREKPCD